MRREVFIVKRKGRRRAKVLHLSTLKTWSGTHQFTEVQDLPITQEGKTLGELAQIMIDHEKSLSHDNTK